jgi:hypothetical protein
VVPVTFVKLSFTRVIFEPKSVTADEMSVAYCCCKMFALCAILVSTCTTVGVISNTCFVSSTKRPRKARDVHIVGAKKLVVPSSTLLPRDYSNCSV